MTMMMMIVIIQIGKTHEIKHALSSSNTQNSINPDHKNVPFSTGYQILIEIEEKIFESMIKK